MRTLWSILLVTVISVPALAQECPPYSEPEINIIKIYDPPRYDNSLNINSIHEMAKGISYKSSSPNELPVGLTLSTQKLDTSFEISAQTSPNGAVCAQITALEIRYGFADTIVYTARDLADSSCGTQEVMDHEQKHVAVDIITIEENLPKLRVIAAGIVNRLGVIKASSVEEANNYFNNAINQQMNELSSGFSVTHDQMQAKVDTPEEYKRLSAACDGDVAGLVSQALKK